MNDFPRVPRSRAPKTDTAENAAFGCGCLVLIGYFAFWALVIYVVAHFVLKFW
jgi:hypothetical protein